MSTALTSSLNIRKGMPTYILIGDGFDEMEVITILHKFRHHGLRIKTVALFNRLVYSHQGVALKSDYLLADNPINCQQPCLLILPVGGRNGEVLRQDARFHSLLQKVIQGEVAIAVTDGRTPLAADINALFQRPAFQPQVDEDLNAFVEILANQLTSN
jgi:putative intracellular protease/amidase